MSNVGGDEGEEETNVVQKVRELMRALDRVKLYKQLSRSLKDFVFIVGASIVLYIVARIAIDLVQPAAGFSELYFVILSLASLLIPLAGVIIGVIHVRHKVNSVSTGEWKPTINQGVPGALKILSEINWEATFEEISIGKLSYTIYGLLKVAAYWFIAFFAFALFGDLLLIHFFHRSLLLAGVLWGVISLFVVLMIQSGDLIRRYREGSSLDLLLWELRWFDSEFRRAKFDKA